MRPHDSAYDRMTAEYRTADPGAGRYALVQDHNGSCSVVGDYDSLEAAIAAAREMDTDEAPTDLEDELGVVLDDAVALIDAAQDAGWRVVATAPAGEYWTVLVEAEV